MNCSRPASRARRHCRLRRRYEDAFIRLPTARRKGASRLDRRRPSHGKTFAPCASGENIHAARMEIAPVPKNSKSHGKTQLLVRKTQEGTGKEEQKGGEKAAETGKRPESQSVGFTSFSRLGQPLWRSRLPAVASSWRTTEVPPAATPAPAAGRTVLLGARFVDGQRPSTDVFPVDLADGLFCILGVRHGDEAESLGSARDSILDQNHFPTAPAAAKRSCNHFRWYRRRGSRRIAYLTYGLVARQHRPISLAPSMTFEYGEVWKFRRKRSRIPHVLGDYREKVSKSRGFKCSLAACPNVPANPTVAAISTGTPIRKGKNSPPSTGKSPLIMRRRGAFRARGGENKSPITWEAGRKSAAVQEKARKSSLLRKSRARREAGLVSNSGSSRALSKNLRANSQPSILLLLLVIYAKSSP